MTFAADMLKYHKLIMEFLDTIPGVLYEYHLQSNLDQKRLLTDNEIYLASPNQHPFNDAFDASLPYAFKEQGLTLEKISIKNNFICSNLFIRRNKKQF